MDAKVSLPGANSKHDLSGPNRVRFRLQNCSSLSYTGRIGLIETGEPGSSPNVLLKSILRKLRVTAVPGASKYRGAARLDVKPAR